MLWTSACCLRGVCVLIIYAVVRADEIDSKTTCDNLDEGTCTADLESRKYRCHIGNNGTMDQPDAYLSIESMTNMEDAAVIASIYRSSHNMKKYHIDSADVDYELVSCVLSCSVYKNASALSVEVTFSIKLEQDARQQHADAYFDHENALCAFWDNERSTWSTWGCRQINDNLHSSYVTCNCNHTTNFGIIAPMEKYDPLGKEAIGIRVPTYTACLISSIVQIAVIWHIVKLRHVVKDHDYLFTLCNLLAASLGTTSTFVCSIEFSKFIIPCTISGIFMHFFYTSSLAWLSAEGVHYYLKVKGKTIEEGFSNKRYYCVLGWAVPAALVGIFVSVHRGYGKHDRCLLTSYSGILSAFIFSAVLFLTIKVLLLVAAMQGYKEARMVKFKNIFLKIRRCIVESVVVIPLLCAIWVFGMTSHTCYAVQVIFYVLFALQGFVLGFYCYFSKEVELARGRNIRKGMMQLRSLSQRGLVFGRVPLEEPASPLETDEQVELNGLHREERSTIETEAVITNNDTITGPMSSDHLATLHSVDMCGGDEESDVETELLTDPVVCDTGLKDHSEDEN